MAKHGHEDDRKLHETFAANVRAYRRAAGLTQEQLGKLCGLHYSYVGRLERRGAGSPQLNTIGRLARALKVTVIDLLTPPQRRERRS